MAPASPGTRRRNRDYGNFGGGRIGSELVTGYLVSGSRKTTQNDQIRFDFKGEMQRVFAARSLSNSVPDPAQGTRPHGGPTGTAADSQNNQVHLCALPVLGSPNSQGCFRTSTKIE